MLDTQQFGQALIEHGFNFYSGVPCSFLKSLINFANNNVSYVAATNEGDAVATCAGATLGGRKSIFLCQNSGLNNAMSPLTSLVHPYQIPMLGFVSLRGETGTGDEPQHQLMGQITNKLLDDMCISWDYLATDMNQALEQLNCANKKIESGMSFFFIVKKSTFSPLELIKKSRKESAKKKEVLNLPGNESQLRRSDILRTLTEIRDDKTILVATTGYTGRELFALGDHPMNFYMIGSMGCVSAFSLGLALTLPDYKIIAIDGDGAILMRLGSLATNAYYAPNNMFHLLLDNEQHESTGGQITVSSNINFTSLSEALGYLNSYHLKSSNDLIDTINQWTLSPALSFAHMRVMPGTLNNLGRPNLTPVEMKHRLCRSLNISVT